MDRKESPQTWDAAPMKSLVRDSSLNYVDADDYDDVKLTNNLLPF